jgi:organic hydroperoxide reductase OsmC/OhrA
MAREHRATIVWHLQGDDFAKGRYSRVHEWRFDGGITVPASPAPGVVPAPFISEQAVDPEEAYVAAISSCHMLTFLDLIRRIGVVVETYEDEAVGEMEELERHRYAVTKVTLKPKIVFRGEAPDAAKLAEMHEKAHKYCFVANSVKSEIVIEART